MTTPTPAADLQTAIGDYMSDRPNRPVGVDELAAATFASRAAVAAMMTMIVNGEARPYPVIRAGRGRYTWVHHPDDHLASVAVLAATLSYITGRHPSACMVTAGHVLSHQLTTTAHLDSGLRTVGWQCRCGLTGHQELPAGTGRKDARRAAWAAHDRIAAAS